MTAPRDNPFRVDRVSALPFLADATRPADDPERVADRLLALRQGALVGPHGSGKSTLLRSVGAVLSERGNVVITAGLPGSASRAQRAKLIHHVAELAGDTPLSAAFVLVDGFEQLSSAQRAAFYRRCPCLLVTAHSTRHLPPLIQLRPTLRTLDAVLHELLGGAASPEFAAVAYAEFARHGGNVRETLFSLYDHWDTVGRQ
ncbi:MAG: hypothetical protein JWM57_1971 [Phycisphaerales bacterium]|nr:hypothetical protein [Phycisphaerales bacterium]